MRARWRNPLGIAVLPALGIAESVQGYTSRSDGQVAASRLRDVPCSDRLEAARRPKSEQAMQKVKERAQLRHYNKSS